MFIDDHICHILFSQMHLDLVPRINGVAVDVDHTSVVELYKIVSVLYCFYRLSNCIPSARMSGGIAYTRDQCIIVLMYYNCCHQCLNQESLIVRFYHTIPQNLEIQRGILNVKYINISCILLHRVRTVRLYMSGVLQ